MYRTTSANGETRTSFSFGRFITNAVPNFSNTGNPDLTPQDLDTLFDFQITAAEPKFLTPSSLYIVGVSPHEKIAARVHKTLLKEGFLTESPPSVDTKKIGKDFVRQFPYIPVFAQKKLVCLLFAWEEELMRWRLLEEEEHEIEHVLEEVRQAGGEIPGELESKLMEVRGLMKVKPSLRSQAARGEESLPAYAESSG